jgi:hypothetical protein
LRAGDVVLDAAGTIHGRVTGRRFGGDHVLLVVEVPGAPGLEVEARGDRLPPVGADVTLAVLPGGAHLIAGATLPP